MGYSLVAYTDRERVMTVDLHSMDPNNRVDWFAPWGKSGRMFACKKTILFK